MGPWATPGHTDIERLLSKLRFVIPKLVTTVERWKVAQIEEDKIKRTPLMIERIVKQVDGISTQTQQLIQAAEKQNRDEFIAITKATLNELDVLLVVTSSVGLTDEAFTLSEATKAFIPVGTKRYISVVANQ